MSDLSEKQIALIRPLKSRSKRYIISKFEIYEFMNFGIGKSVVIKHVNNFEFLKFRNAKLLLLLLSSHMLFA